jgi:hypothetical protein
MESPMTDYKTLDSGQREDYATGARRDIRTGKGRYDLLPPFAIRRVAGVYERGAAKYGDRNYERGIPLTRYLDSALRHTFEVLEGKTDEDHAAQAAWNLLAFIQTQEMIGHGLLPENLNDLPNYTPETREPQACPHIGQTETTCGNCGQRTYEDPAPVVDERDSGGSPDETNSVRYLRVPLAGVPFEAKSITIGYDERGFFRLEPAPTCNCTGYDPDWHCPGEDSQHWQKWKSSKECGHCGH